MKPELRMHIVDGAAYYPDNTELKEGQRLIEVGNLYIKVQLPESMGWRSRAIPIGGKSKDFSQQERKFLEPIVENFYDSIQILLKNLQLNALRNAVLVWFFPLVAIYSFALSIRWVYCGFKKEKV